VNNLSLHGSQTQIIRKAQKRERERGGGGVEGRFMLFLLLYTFEVLIAVLLKIHIF
jgi:hypothetical protein